MAALTTTPRPVNITLMKLRIILITISLMAFFSAWTGGYLYYSSIKTSAFDEANKQAISHMETIKGYLSFFLLENSNSVRALAGLKELSNALIRQDQFSLDESNFVLDVFTKNYQADVCYLIDRDGRTIASSNRNSRDNFVGQNYAFRPYFQQAIKGGPTDFLGYMALGMTSGKRGIYYSHPVYKERQDKPIGVVVIKAPINPIEREFAKEYEGRVLLTDPNGIIFITNHHEWAMHSLSKLSEEETRSVQSYQQFGEGPWPWTGVHLIDDSRATDRSGNEYLFHKIALENYPGWNLIFLSDINSILTRVRGPLIRVSGYLIITLCITFGLTVFFLYNKANHEINQRIKAEQALKRSHDELEERVEDRTLELTTTVEELRKEIGERKRAVQAFRVSEEKYRTLTDNLSVGVFRSTPGPKGNYIEVNSAYMRMLGFNEKSTLYSLSVYELYQNPEDRDKFSRKMLQDGAVKNEEIIFKRRDGTLFCGSVTAVVVKDDHGKVLHYDGILVDVTELRLAKEEAQKRREEIAHMGRVATMGELSASLAHELNQPLTAILSNAQAALRFLAGDRADLDEIREILDDIVADDRRAGKVIDRLRSLFRKGDCRKESVDINELINDVISLINTETKIRNVSIETLLEPGLSPVLADKIQLHQVVINLILNASEAMTDGGNSPGKITISTTITDEKMVKVSVRDNGIGLLEDSIAKMTEPFFTTKTDGMGMGLSINRTIIDAHMGRLWAENNSPRGATFHFTLPVHEKA